MRVGIWRWAWSCGLGIRKRRSQEVGVACRGLGPGVSPSGVGEVLQEEVGLAGAGPLKEALDVGRELRGGLGSRAFTAGGATGVQRPTRSGRGIYVEGFSPKVEPRRVAARGSKSQSDESTRCVGPRGGVGGGARCEGPDRVELGIKSHRTLSQKLCLLFPNIENAFCALCG